MKRETILFIIHWLVTFGIMSIIGVIWKCLELHYYGVIKPSSEDTIIGSLFMLSVYLNVDNWIK